MDDDLSLVPALQAMEGRCLDPFQVLGRDVWASAGATKRPTTARPAGSAGHNQDTNFR